MIIYTRNLKQWRIESVKEEKLRKIQELQIHVKLRKMCTNVSWAGDRATAIVTISLQL